MRIKILLIKLFISLNICFAQEFKVDYLHGVNSINSISIIDDNVWVGGYLGLTRIGRLNHNEHEYIINPFINHQNSCFNLYAQNDNNGNLFVHDDYNLYKYTEGTIELVDNGNQITDFYIDENNTRWILRGNSITKIENDGTKITYNSQNSSLPEDNYHCIFVKNNMIYIGSRFGYVRFDGKNSQFFNSSNSIIPFSHITSIAVDKNENLWLACDTTGFIGGDQYFHYNKLVKISGNDGAVYDPYALTKKGYVFKIVPNEENIYLCTNVGLIKFNGSEFTVINKEKNHLLSNKINDIAFGDKKIWIGTDSGISVLSPDSTINIEISNTTLSSGQPGPIIEDLSGNIWVGSGHAANGRLSKYDGQTWKTIIQGTLDEDVNISSLAVDRNNVIWAVSFSWNGRIYKIAEDSIKVYNSTNSPIPYFLVDIVIDKDNNKWVIDLHEVVMFDDSTWTRYNANDFPELIMPVALAADKKGNVWIGVSQNGMIRFDGKNWTHYNNAFFGKEYSTVHNFKIDSNDNLWFTHYYGISETRIGKFDGNTLTWYDQNINLPDGAGLLTVEENGNLWINYNDDSEAGIAQYDWKEWKFYNSANSRLIGNEYGSFLIDKNENKWVSAGCYIAKFNEESIFYSPVDSIKNNDYYYSIFPNPCGNSVFLKSLKSGNADVHINLFDLRGSLIKSYFVHVNHVTELDLIDCKSGMYIMQIIGKDFLETHKLLKID